MKTDHEGRDRAREPHGATIPPNRVKARGLQRERHGLRAGRLGAGFDGLRSPACKAKASCYRNPNPQMKGFLWIILRQMEHALPGSEISVH